MFADAQQRQRSPVSCIQISESSLLSPFPYSRCTGLSQFWPADTLLAIPERTFTVQRHVGQFRFLSLKISLIL